MKRIKELIRKVNLALNIAGAEEITEQEAYEAMVDYCSELLEDNLTCDICPFFEKCELSYQWVGDCKEAIKLMLTEEE